MRNRMSKQNKEKIHWLRMLPHVYNDAIGIRNIVCDDESKNILFEYLFFSFYNPLLIC